MQLSCNISRIYTSTATDCAQFGHRVVILKSEICGEISSVLYYLDSLPPEMKSRIEIIRFEDIWERPNQFSQMIMEQAKLGPQDNLLDEYLYDQFRNGF